jgi:hypothetical protein
MIWKLTSNVGKTARLVSFSLELIRYGYFFHDNEPSVFDHSATVSVHWKSTNTKQLSYHISMQAPSNNHILHYVEECPLIYRWLQCHLRWTSTSLSYGGGAPMSQPCPATPRPPSPLLVDVIIERPLGGARAHNMGEVRGTFIPCEAATDNINSRNTVYSK